jgi:Fe-S cluster assembly protein SufD
MMNIQPKSLEETDRRLPKDASAQLVGYYKALGSRLPGAQNPRVQKLRDDAIAAFAARGLPHRRVEEWKYTDLRNAMPQAFEPVAEGAVDRLALDKLLGALAAVGGARMVFVNGRYSPELSVTQDLPEGVRLASLAEAFGRASDDLTDALGTSKSGEGEVVTLLNTAFATDGVVLRIAEGAKLADPMHLIHVATSDTPASAALRNVVTVEKGAEATLIETYVSAGNAAVQMNSVTEIVVADGGKLHHYTVAAENADTQHLASSHVALGAKADFLAVQFASGGRLSRLQTFVTYNGEGTRAHFIGCQLLRNRQHCDMTLVIDHAAVGCESREHVKAVLDDHAQGVFQAKVIVRPGAQQTDGRQMAQSLLLSDTAEFDAKPELEIYADDVKCNHGATTGAIDEDLLFYLRARGIPEDQAKALLIQAFIGEVLDRVEHEGLRQALEAKAALWLLPQG